MTTTQPTGNAAVDKLAARQAGAAAEARSVYRRLLASGSDTPADVAALEAAARALGKTGEAMAGDAAAITMARELRATIVRGKVPQAELQAAAVALEQHQASRNWSAAWGSAARPRTGWPGSPGCIPTLSTRPESESFWKVARSFAAPGEHERRRRGRLDTQMTMIHDTVAEQRDRLAGMKPLPGGNGDAAPPVQRLNFKTFGERDKYAAEVNTFLRYGHRGEMIQRFALTTESGGQTLLPVEIGAPVDPGAGNANPFRRAHQLYGVPVLETTKPDSLILPLLDAAAGTQLVEGAAGENENDPATAGSLVLRPRTYSSGSLWVSNTLLLAAGTDLTVTLLPNLESQKERAVGASIAAAIVADAAIVQTAATASTTTLTRQNLISLTRAIPRRYRELRAIVLGSQAYEAAEDLIASDGHPVLEFDPQDPTLRRVNGTPVLRSDGFEAFGAAKTVGCVVSLLGFRLRDAAPRRVSRMVVPSRPDQTGLAIYSDIAFAYAVGAIAKLRTPAA